MSFLIFIYKHVKEHMSIIQESLKELNKYRHTPSE